MLEYVVREILWIEEKVIEHGQTDMELLEEEMEGRRITGRMRRTLGNLVKKKYHADEMM